MVLSCSVFDGWLWLLVVGEIPLSLSLPSLRGACEIAVRSLVEIRRFKFISSSDSCEAVHHPF